MNEPTFIAVAALLGLVLGSFLNVVIHRLPRMMERQWAQDVSDWLAQQEAKPGELAEPTEPYSLLRPGSHCPSCTKPLSWADKIPVVSYLGLRGRCRHCSAPIGRRYPLVELVTAVLFAACAWRWGASPAALAWAAFAAVLLALACIDADTQLLPDDLTLPLAWAGLIVAALGWTAVSLSQALWGAVAGYLLLWLVHHGFKWVTGRQGMGQGDFKLLAALGAWLGWPALLPVVLLASGAGAAVGIGLRLSGRLQAGEPLPFGPYLALAGLLLMFAPHHGADWFWR